MELVIPILTTERLILRPFREEDAAALFALSQDPDVVRFVGDRRVPTLQESWRAVAGWLGHWTLRAYGQWAIEELSTGAFVGRAGIINPAEWPGPEVGYLLGKAWWGRGFATEAARAAMNWGFSEIGFDELISLIDPANAASIAVATRLGETLRDEIEVWGYRLRRYAITRQDWQGQVAR